MEVLKWLTDAYRDYAKTMLGIIFAILLQMLLLGVLICYNLLVGLL